MGGSLQALIANLYRLIKGRTAVATHLTPADKPLEEVGANEGGIQNSTTLSKKNRRPRVEQARAKIEPKIATAKKKVIAKAKTKAAKSSEGDR